MKSYFLQLLIHFSIVALSPATNNKLLHFKVKEVAYLFHTIFHSSYPVRSKPKPPVRRSSFKKTNIEINNLQPSQFLNRPFPPSSFSPDTQEFFEKYKFQYSDVTEC